MLYEKTSKQTNTHTLSVWTGWELRAILFYLFFSFVFFFFFNHHPRIHFYSFWRERQKGGGRGEAVCGGGERGRQRERQDNQLLPASSVCLMGGGTCNPGVCPDQIPKLQPFGVQEDAPTNWASWATWPGPGPGNFKIKIHCLLLTQFLLGPKKSFRPTRNAHLIPLNKLITLKW